MAKFKSEAIVKVSGITTVSPTKAFMNNGDRNVVSIKVKVDTMSSAVPYELQVWGDKAHSEDGDAVMQVVKGKDVRVVAVGYPVDQVFNDKIQKRVQVIEMWAESIEDNRFVAVILPKHNQEEDVREYKPIDMPELIVF